LAWWTFTIRVGSPPHDDSRMAASASDQISLAMD
jgi:hypothetical protein